MGRGRGPSLIERPPLVAPLSWRPSDAKDYDPAFYQAFYAPGPGENARVYAPLAEGDFRVEVHRAGEWHAWRVSAGACACLGPRECEHQRLLELARAAGLRSQRVLDPGSFGVLRRPPYVELRAAIPWPLEVGPRMALVSGDLDRSAVRLHETGEHPVTIVERRTCTCRRPQPCLHRQLVAIAFA